MKCNFIFFKSNNYQLRSECFVLVPENDTDKALIEKFKREGVPYTLNLSIIDTTMIDEDDVDSYKQAALLSNEEWDNEVKRMENERKRIDELKSVSERKTIDVKYEEGPKMIIESEEDKDGN
jgi:hypothetical protein